MMFRIVFHDRLYGLDHSFGQSSARRELPGQWVNKALVDAIFAQRHAQALSKEIQEDVRFIGCNNPVMIFVIVKWPTSLSGDAGTRHGNAVLRRITADLYSV
jgi:hypothetical protein